MAGDKRKSFGPYQLGKHIRREGSYIEVFEAFDTKAEEDVEIRILKIPLKKTTDGLSERFCHEVDLLARVDHPSIVRVMDVGQEQGFAYYTVPLIAHLPLKQYQEDRGGLLDFDTVLRFGEILTDALCVLHGMALLHRGISTKTVFVERERAVPYFGECSVMKDIRDRYGLSAQGVPSLSLYANAPEMLTLDAWSPSSDVYQMCALMFRLLTNKTALPTTIPAQYQATYEGIVDIALPGDVLACHGDLAGLDAVLVRGLEFSPAARFQSAEELRDALRGVARKRNLKLLLRDEVARVASTAHVRPRETAEERRKRRRTERREKRAKTDVAKLAPTTSRPYLWLAIAITIPLLLVLLLSYHVNTLTPADSAGQPVGTTTHGTGSTTHTTANTDQAVKPTAVKGPPRSREAIKKSMLQVFEACKTERDGDKRFRRQWTALNAWVKTLPQPIEGIGSHIDMLKLRMRYTSGDKTAARELDTIVDRAVEHVKTQQ